MNDETFLTSDPSSQNFENLYVVVMVNCCSVRKDQKAKDSEQEFVKSWCHDMTNVSNYGDHLEK